MGGGGSKSKEEYIVKPVNPYNIGNEDGIKDNDNINEGFTNYQINDNKYITIDKLLCYFNIAKYNPIVIILLVLFIIIFIVLSAL